MNASQSQMRKTGQAGGEFGSTNFGQLTQTGNNFGAANSALNDIKNLPIDTIKIDKNYAQKMEGDVFAQSFVKTVSELASSVDVDVCVEGVEEDNQITMIGDYPVNLVQGFFFDKPLSKEEFGKKYI